MLLFIVGVMLFVPFNSKSPGLGTTALLLIAALPVSYVATRFMMILPAKAIGENMTLTGAFEASFRNGWRLVIATWAPSIMTALLLQPLAWFAGRLPTWLTRILHKFPDAGARRVVFPGCGAEIFQPEHSSHYVRTGKLSTHAGNTAIPGSVAVQRRKFMQYPG